MNTLFLVTLILEGLVGIGFVLAPSLALSPFGVTLNDISTPFARLYGSAVIGLSILLWFARKSDHPEFKRGAVCSLFVFYLVSTVVLLKTQIAGLMNALGWSLIGIHAVLSVWFGYFIVKK